MTKPDILTAIDAALAEHPPERVEAIATGDMLHAAMTFTDQIGQRVSFYQGVELMRSLAELEGGFMVRVKPE